MYWATFLQYSVCLDAHTLCYVCSTELKAPLAFSAPLPRSISGGLGTVDGGIISTIIASCRKTIHSTDAIQVHSTVVLAPAWSIVCCNSLCDGRCVVTLLYPCRACCFVHDASGKYLGCEAAGGWLIGSDASVNLLQVCKERMPKVSGNRMRRHRICSVPSPKSPLRFP